MSEWVNSDVLQVFLHTHTTVLLLFWNLSRTTRVSRYQKGKTRKAKTNLDLLEQEIVSGSGICWAICKSAPHPRQPRQHPTTQFFTGWMPFLPPNQQRQSTEGKMFYNCTWLKCIMNLWVWYFVTTVGEHGRFSCWEQFWQFLAGFK